MSFSEWKTYKLNDALEALIDYRGKTPKKTASGVPLVTAKIVKNGFIEKPNEFIAEEDYDSWMVRGLPKIGDVVLTTEAPLGEVAQIKDSRIALAQRIVTLRGKKGVLDNSYLKYFLFSKIGQHHLKERETGTTVSGIKQSELRLVEIDCPPYEKQIIIGNILSSLDDAIELNQQINKTLEEMAKAIFKEWFVDFKFPISSEQLINDDLSDNTDLLKSSQSFNQKNQRFRQFQETEIGKIPVGWKVGKLGDVAEINPKLSLKKGSISKYVEMKDLSENSVIIKSYREREFSSGSKFQNGDTLLARITPCLENGKTGLVSILDENETGWGSTEFIVLRGKGSIGSNFIYCLSRYEPFRNHAIKSMLGSSGRQRVVESMLIEFSIAIPPNELLINFEKLVTPFFNQINNNEKENQSLINLRDTLLPKLMNGEIEIKKLQETL